MEDVEMTGRFWHGRRVFVTGHTGFKGSWLSLWLQRAGAQVHGYATVAPTEPNLFAVAGVEAGLAAHVIGDVRDGSALKDAMTRASPEVVFHLAAQPIVRHSYAEPVETYSVNVLGTVNLFEAVRACPSVRAVVNVTTDKCYQNMEWVWGYRESEALGGHDPYSSSKACSELVTAAYRDSFLAAQGVAVASARAGNVIGGGDWAADRLIPDFLRAADANQPVEIRHPDATRPWQHVLEPLSGYLTLAEALLTQGTSHAGAWNFGPADADAQPVRWILDRLSTALKGSRWQHVGGNQVHEAHLLKLDSTKARTALGWTPRWDLAQALDRTIEWHRAWRAGQDMRAQSLQQIQAHENRAHENHVRKRVAPH